MGAKEDASDFGVVIDWTDFQSRSMSQAADALGSSRRNSAFPAELLWDRIPNVTPDVAASWQRYKQQNPSAEEQLADALRGQASGAVGGGNTAN